MTGGPRAPAPMDYLDDITAVIISACPELTDKLHFNYALVGRDSIEQLAFAEEGKDDCAPGFN